MLDPTEGGEHMVVALAAMPPRHGSSPFVSALEDSECPLGGTACLLLPSNH